MAAEPAAAMVMSDLMARVAVAGQSFTVLTTKRRESAAKAFPGRETAVDARQSCWARIRASGAVAAAGPAAVALTQSCRKATRQAMPAWAA